MKKIIAVSISSLLILGLMTGCGCSKNKKEVNKNKKTNTEVNEKMSNITLKNSKIFEGLNILNDNTLETQLGINRNFVESHAVGISMYGSTTKLYIIIKPKEENKKIVKQALDLYIERVKEKTSEENNKYNNTLKEEYNGYYVYIISENNKEIFNQIKEYLK